MAVDVANFIARNFNAPDRAEEDRIKYGNALMRNQVARIPQANRTQDLAIQGDEQALTQQGTAFNETQKQNARGVLARSLAAIAQSPQPKIAAQQLIASPDFRAAGTMLGLPVDQFTVTEQDTPEKIASGAKDWAQALGAKIDQPEPFTLSAGQTRYGPGGQPIASVPEKLQSPTDDQREYEMARQQGFKGSFYDYLTSLRKAGATSIDMTQKTPPPPQGMVYELDPDQNNRLGYKLVPIPGARDQRTEAQQKAGLLSQRMKTLSADILDAAPGMTEQIAATLAQSGGVKGGLANSYLTPELQKHFNAARGWLAGVLRQDTGATIQPFELQEYYPTFFPVPGDGPEVIKQKKRLRDVTQAAITANSGVPTGESSSAGPRVGEVQDGYRFLGGDPGQQQNWQKVQ